MTPANHRPMHPRDRRDNICRAALYSVPGVCRCPRCAPASPTPGIARSDPPPGQPAAAPTLDPSPKGGGLFDCIPGTDNDS